MNVLDIAQNSISAGAGLIEIYVVEAIADQKMTITVKDDGCGMDADALKCVCDPFFTTRRSRDIGLGVPLFKQTAELTGGSFQISSALGKGTVITAEFFTDNVNCLPLGDIASALSCLIALNPKIDFVFKSVKDDGVFTFDTRKIRRILGDNVSLEEPFVLSFIEELINENFNH